MTSDKEQKHFVLTQLPWKRNCCSSKTTPPFIHSQTHTSPMSLALSLSFALLSLITHTNTLCVCWRIWKINVSDLSSLSVHIELLWQSFSSSAMAASQYWMNKKRFNSFFSLFSPVGHDSTQIIIPPQQLLKNFKFFLKLCWNILTLYWPQICTKMHLSGSTFMIVCTYLIVILDLM